MTFTLQKLKNGFSERISQRNKKILFVQLLLIVLAGFVCYQAIKSINTPAYNTYSVISKLLLGLITLLTSIDYYRAYKQAKRSENLHNYILSFILTLFWFGWALGQFFF